MDEIRKKLLVKQALSEGWGRSIVGGNEVITAPSVKAELNPLLKSTLDNELVSQDGQSAGYEPQHGTEDALEGEDLDMEGLLANAELRENGEMSVSNENGNHLSFYKKDISDSNSLYRHMKTGRALFNTIEEQEAQEKEFNKIYENQMRNRGGSL